MIKRRTGQDSGFTLVELLIVIVILGVLAVPLSNLLYEGFHYYATAETRLADSHDIQITTAYYSQDVANTGTRSFTTNPASGVPVQSVWTGTHPTGTYCGQSVTGSSVTVVLYLEWDDIQVGSTGATVNRYLDSAAYLAVTNGTTTNLVRVYCPGTVAAVGTGAAPASGTGTSATMAHNYVYPDSTNATPVTCTPSCNPTNSFPTSISFTLSIKGPTDTSVSHVTLTGTGRPSP